MAKDDYEIIAYKILVYLYGCLKREITFDTHVFESAIKKNVKNEEYFADILRIMQTEGLITGLAFTRAWGHEYILISDLEEMEITPEGIRFLKDNSKTEKVKSALRDTRDIILGLMEILKLI